MKKFIFLVIPILYVSCDNQEQLCSDPMAQTLLKDITAEEVTKQAFISEVMTSVGDDLDMAILMGLTTREEAIQTIEEPIRAEYGLYFNGEPNDLDDEIKEMITSVKSAARSHITSINYIRPKEINEETRTCSCSATLLLDDSRELDVNYTVQETEENIFVEVDNIATQITLEHFKSVQPEFSRIISPLLTDESKEDTPSIYTAKNLYCASDRCNFHKYENDNGWVKTGPYLVRGDKAEIRNWEDNGSMAKVEFTNPKGQTSIGWIKLNDLSEVKQYRNDKKPVDKIVAGIFQKWEKEMISRNIFDYVLANECENRNKMEELYDSGKYPMTSQDITYLEFHLNGDNIKDYLISYKLSNCVGGNGWSRDMILAVSNPDKGTYDLEFGNKIVNNTIKRQFLDFVVNTTGEQDPYAKENEDFIETKGLVPQHIDDLVLYGQYYIEADGGTCCPEFEGNFKFDFNTAELTHSEPKKVTYKWN